MTPIECVVDALAAKGCNPRKSGSEYSSKCPNTNRHKRGDKNPSLSVGESPEGKALVFCHGGCTTPEIVDALDLRFVNLFPKDTVKVTSGGRLGQEVARYRYTDEDGVLLFEVVRYRSHDGKKTFRQRRPNGQGGWIWNRHETRNVLYMLPQVRTAVEEQRTIVICEGEKDAETAQWSFSGCAATCNVGGAGKFTDELVEQLHGATHVIIVADDDTTGHAHARDIATKLEGHVGEVELLLPAEGFKDLTEMTGAGKTIADLRPFDVGSEPPADSPSDQPPTDEDLETEGILRSMLIDWDEFWANDHEAEEWIAKPVIPAKRSVSIHAPGGTGKSLLALYIAAAIATGRSCMNAPAQEPVSVLYADYEMTKDDLAERLEAMGYGPDVDMRNLHYALLPSMEPLDTPQGAGQFRRLAQIVEAQVCIIDTFARAVKGDENEADTVRNFYRFTGSAIKGDDRALVRIDHTGKDPDKGARGTSAKRDDVDVVWKMTLIEGGAQLKAEKRRMSWVPETVTLIKRDDDNLEFLMAPGTVPGYPAGTSDCMAKLDEIGLPVTATRRQAAEALRNVGYRARNNVVGAAVKCRKNAQNLGPQNSGTKDFETGRGPKEGPKAKHPLTCGDQAGDHGDQAIGRNGDQGWSLIRDHPGPRLAPDRDSFQVEQDSEGRIDPSDEASADDPEGYSW